MTPPPGATDLLATLAGLPGRQARLDWLLTEARAWPRFDEASRAEAQCVPGCLSRLWLRRRFDGDVCQFEADSDSQVVRALAGLVCRFYSGQSPAEILARPGLDLEARGLNLATSNRRNALSRVEVVIRDFARAAAAGSGADAARPNAPQGTPGSG